MAWSPARPRQYGARAAAFFAELFGWTFTAEPGGGLCWSRAAAGIGDHPWAFAITEEPSAARVRLGFEVPDPAEALARARSLGGAGRSPEVAADDQGLPIAFSAHAPRPQLSKRATGELGVAVALVDDTAKAKAFYEALFGDVFHQIGPQDRWWSNHAAFGIFSNTLGQAYPARVDAGGAPELHVFVCVRGLAEHKRRLMALGGGIVAESAMGPYEVCAGRDDQGTRFHLWRDPDG